MFLIIAFQVRRIELCLFDFQDIRVPCIDLVLALFQPMLEHGDLPVLVRIWLRFAILIFSVKFLPTRYPVVYLLLSVAETNISRCLNFRSIFEFVILCDCNRAIVRKFPFTASARDRVCCGHYVNCDFVGKFYANNKLHFETETE